MTEHERAVLGVLAWVPYQYLGAEAIRGALGLDLEPPAIERLFLVLRRQGLVETRTKGELQARITRRGRIARDAQKE
jgi:hypothetical protein